MTEPRAGLSIERVHLSIRLASLFFPLAGDDLYPWAEQHEYQLSEDIQRISQPLLPSGVRMSVGGRIARNPTTGNNLILQPDRAFVAIEGQSIIGVLDDFSSLWNSIQESGIVDLTNAAEVRFVEFILDAAFGVGRSRDPIDTIRHVYSESSLIPALSEALGRNVTNFGVRLVEQGSLPTGDRWFEIKIEPAVRRPQSEYSVRIVNREPTREPVVSLANAAPSLIETMVAALEASR